jgi:hypothetical protein
VFTGSVRVDDKLLGSDEGKFNVGDVEIELINTRADAEFMSLLANQTRGKYFTVSNYKELYALLEKLKSESSKEKISVNEINLWSNNWLMIVIILIFGIEWFLRKRGGML